MSGLFSRAEPVGAVQRASRVRGVVWRALITVAVLAILLWVLPVAALWAAIERITSATWAVVVIGFLLGHAVAACKWRLLVGACGVRFTMGEALRAHAAGLFANLCLPSLVGGDVVRAGLVVRRHGQVEVVALGSLVDRILDTFALTLLAGAGGLALAGELDRVAVLVLVVAGVGLPLCVVAAAAAVLLVPGERLPEKVARAVSRVASAIRALSSQPGKALLVLLVSLAIQFAFVQLNILIAVAIGIELSMWVWLLAWPLAKIVALIPVSLGGIGVREVALAGLLAPFGVEAVHAVAQSLCWEVVLVGSGLLCGAFAAFGGRFLPRNEVLT